MICMKGETPWQWKQISLLLKSSGSLSNWNFAWSTSVSADSGLLPCYLIPFLTPHCLFLLFRHFLPLDFPKKLNFPYIIMQREQLCFPSTTKLWRIKDLSTPRMLSRYSKITVSIVSDPALQLQREMNRVFAISVFSFHSFPPVFEKEERSREVLLNCWYELCHPYPPLPF